MYPLSIGKYYINMCKNEARKSRVKKEPVKHYDVIFRDNNSKVFYLVNNNGLVTRDDLII